MTTASLLVQCSTAEALKESSTAMRPKELYHLEIYNDASKLVKNLSSAEGVHFEVTDLPPGVSFNLFVYASNANGRSEQVPLNANTLVGEPRKLG